MYERIQIDHNGTTIHYSENEDLWRCQSMDLEAKTLSALRTKINAALADARRMNCPVFTVATYGIRIEHSGTATLLDDDGKSVWVVFDEIARWGGKDRTEKRRRKFSIDYVFRDTPEARALRADVVEKVKALEQAIKEQKERLKAIPTITIEDVITANAKPVRTP